MKLKTRFVVGQQCCKSTFFQNYPDHITKIVRVVLAKSNGKLIDVSYLLKKFVNIATRCKSRL